MKRTRESISEAWRTSLQVRVIGTIFAVSAVLMMLLGIGLASLFSQRIVDSRVDIANTEVDRARVVVEEHLAASGSGASLQSRLTSARAALNQQSALSFGTLSIYEPVLQVVQGEDIVASSPEGFRIPENLTRFIDQGQVAYQFAETDRSDGSRYKALIIGTPTHSEIPGLQLYLVMSMETEETTLAIMRGMLALAAGVVVVLIVAVVWLATQQVTAPVRSASRIAQRLAAGHLRERMVVRGEDEMARLALSFNDMADKLSHQIHQLEEYGDLQRQFTSDVSHELRTPLTTVRMAADMIAQESDSFDAYTKRATQLMITELDRFEALLTDLLEISRHDAGVADLSEARIDMNQCVSSAWEQTQMLAEELGVKVNFDFPEHPENFDGDPRRIERILRNLLANAIDHSECNPVDVVVRGNDESVAVTVTDHGVGLKPGQEELVFNRFWRADASRKRHFGGTGLGLAIANEDAQLHGGSLQAASTFGVGSQFRLVVPRQPNEPVSTPALELNAPVADAEEEQD